MALVYLFAWLLCHFKNITLSSLLSQNGLPELGRYIWARYFRVLFEHLLSWSPSLRNRMNLGRFPCKAWDCWSTCKIILYTYRTTPDILLKKCVVESERIGMMHLVRRIDRDHYFWMGGREIYIKKTNPLNMCKPNLLVTSTVLRNSHSTPRTLCLFWPHAFWVGAWGLWHPRKIIHPHGWMGGWMKGL